MALVQGSFTSLVLAFRQNSRQSAKAAMILSRAILTLPLCAGASALLITPGLGRAATYVRTSNSGSLNDTNWLLNGVAAANPPGPTDIGLFNSTTGAAQTDAVGAPYTIGELQITNPTGLITITDTNNLLTINGINGVGIDMSAATQSLTLNAGVVLGSNQTWNVASSRVLSQSIGVSDNAAGYGIVKAGGGTLTFTDAAVNTFGGALTIAAGTLNPQYNAATNQSNNLPTTATLGFAGGTLSLQEEGTQNGVANVQTVASTIVSQGESQIAFNRVSGGIMKIQTGTITRTIGGTIFFNGVTAKNVNQYVEATGTNTASGIIGGWAITDTYGFAAYNGSSANVYTGTETASNFSANTLNTDCTTSFTAAAGATTGSLRFNTAGAETLTLNGANAIDSGGILVTPTTAAFTQTITGGTSLTSNNGTDLIVYDLDTTSGGALVINSSIVDNTSNSIGLTKSGGGILVLGGANTFTGGVYFNDGTIKLNNAGALNATGVNAINFGNAAAAVGTLTLNGFSPTVSSLSTAANLSGLNPIIQNANSSAVTLTLGSSSATTTVFAGTIQDGSGGGSLSIIKTGTSTQTIGGALTYTGATNVSGGTLKLTSSPTASTLITVGSGTMLDATEISTGSLALGAGQTLSGLGTVKGGVSAGSGAFIAPGTGTFNSGGTGTLTIGSLTLSGGAVINLGLLPSIPAGNLISTGTLTLPTSGNVNIDAYTPGTSTAFTTPGTYDLFLDTSIAGGTVANLALASSHTGLNATFGSSGGYVTLTLATATTNRVWSGAGTNTNWSNTGNWVGGVVPTNPGDGATFTQGTPSTSVPVVVNLDTNETVGTMAFTSTSGAYNISGAGPTLTLDNKGAGATIADTGTNLISVPVALNDNLTVSGPGVFTIAGNISEVAVGKSISENGSGTLVLGGSNTYTGGTAISGGVINFAHAATNDGNIGATATALTIGGGTLQWAVGNTDDISSTRTTNFASGNAGLDTNGNNVTLSNPVGNGGAGGLTKVGAGTLTLAGTNTYNGTTLVKGGFLSISSNANLGNQTTGAAVAINGGTLLTTATLTLDNGGSSDRPLTLGTAGGNLNIASGTTLTVDGAITGTGQLIMNGTGQLTILNPNVNQNTYDSGTVINAGTILTGDINSQMSGLGGGPVTFNGSGATLNLKYSASTSPTYGTFPNNIIIPAGQGGELITTPRGDVSGTVTGGGTFTVLTSYTRSQFDNDFSNFTGQLIVLPTVGGGSAGGDFRLDSTTGLAMATLNLSSGTNFYDVFNFAAGGLTESIGALTGAGELSGGPAAGRTMTWSIGGLNTSTVFTGPIDDNTGPTAIIKVGTGTLTLSGTDLYSGATTVSAGTLAVANGFALPAVNGAGSPLALGTTLNISTGASVVAVNDVSSGVLVPYAAVVGSLNNTGTLDVRGNALIINGTANTLAALTAQAAAGYNGGKWNGSSVTGVIISSTAAADSTHLTAVGVIANDTAGSTAGGGTPLYGTLDGTATSDGNILIKYTYYGDTDLSGVIDGSDYSRIDYAFLNNQNASNPALTGWFNGDFNYDGVIDGSDYTLIDNAFNQQGASLATNVAQPSAQVSGSSAVPEPATLSLIGIGAVGLLGRRTRPGNRQHQ